MRYAMRRLTLGLAIGGLTVAVVIAMLALTTLGDNVAEAQETDCVTAGAVPAGNAGLAQDCETLLGFMHTLRGSAALNWSPSTSIKQWTGVRLGGSPQRVTIIKLQRQALDGSISAGMGKVEKLVHLWLYSNSLTGPLPAEIGDLADLETLMLANNDLSGQIPEQLNNLTLSRLWLKNNDFTGCVPYNLTLVPDNDLSAVDLPACDPPDTDTDPDPDPDPGTDAPESLSDMVKRVRPAVVKVINGAPDDPIFSYGTGFIFRTEDAGAAYIMTNHHVVDEAEEVWVLVDDQDLFQADIEAVDPRRDLALLRICCGEFTTVEFMVSGVLNPGDEVIAIGYGAAFFPAGELTEDIQARQDHEARRGDGHSGHNLRLSL